VPISDRLRLRIVDRADHRPERCNVSSALLAHCCLKISPNARLHFLGRIRRHSALP
jgi:hypothetical protein